MAIRNRKRLKRKLLKIPEAVKAEMRLQLETGAEQITSFQRQMVPVESGDLRDSINWVYGQAPKGTLTIGKVSGKPDARINDLKISIFAGNEKAYYARWVEF